MNVNGKVLSEVETAEGPAVDGVELINSILGSVRNEPSLDELVETDRRNRVVAAMKEIEQVLNKYRCRLEIVPTITIFPN